MVRYGRNMWSDFYVVKHKSDLFFMRLYAAHFTCGQRGAEIRKSIQKLHYKSPFHTRSEACGSIPLFQLIVKPLPTFSRCICCDAIDKEKGVAMSDPHIVLITELSLTYIIESAQNGGE